MKYLYTISVAPGLEYDCLGEDSLHLKLSDEVIVKCERYQDIGVILKSKEGIPVDENKLQHKRMSSAKGRRVEGQKVPVVIRRATLNDKGKAHENEVRARTMHRTALKKVVDHALGMKLINTHCSFDGNLVVFQFTADGRVDFRDLLRDLAQEFRTRVELRQVGVRDEASIQGGLGPCGRRFCCSTFLNRFVSINVKMAKQQGLSLNPCNISGACGRLKCCLNYETEWYQEKECCSEGTPNCASESKTSNSEHDEDEQSLVQDNEDVVQTDDNAEDQGQVTSSEDGLRLNNEQTKLRQDNRHDAKS